MGNRDYKSLSIVIIYLMLLRVVLYITTGISIFNFGMLFDLIIMIFFIGVISALFRHKISQKVFYVIIIVFFSVIVIADVIYIEYFEVITSRSNLFGVSRLAEGNTSEYGLNIHYVVYMILPFTLLSLYFIISKKKIDVFCKKDFRIISLLLLIQVGCFLLLGNHNFDSKNEYYKSDAYLFETMYNKSVFSEKYGYFNYHIIDLIRINKSINEEVAFDKINLFFDEKEIHIENEYSDIYAGYNIINIVGETLETRFIDSVLTPNLYMMLNEGYSFENYYATVFQQGATCNTEFMGLTGISAVPSNHSINNVCDSYGENTYTYALPNQLKSIGYNTYYFHSGFEWFYNRKELNVQYGFETSKFQEDMYDLGYVEFYDRFDTDMIYFLDEYLNYDELFYLDLLTYSGHGAYNQEEFDTHYFRVEEAYPENDFDSEMINYMAKLVELDNLIELLIEQLTINGQMDNTLFVIYPDHYPYMLNQELYSEYTGLEVGTHEIMRQDLIIYATNMDSKVISMTGSTIDIAPTVLNLIDSSLEFKYFIGKDLLSNVDNYVLFSDLTITDGENYLMINEDFSNLSSGEANLVNILGMKIYEYELQKDLLMIDYFKKLKEIEQ